MSMLALHALRQEALKLLTLNSIDCHFKNIVGEFKLDLVARRYVSSDTFKSRNSWSTVISSPSFISFNSLFIFFQVSLSCFN